MSDNEEVKDESKTGEGEAKPAEEESESIKALKNVLKKALWHDGLARGLHESVRALEQRKAHLCVLAKDCDESAFTTLVTALCKEHNIPLVTVPENAKLGEWVGLCKYDKDMKPRKVVGCSVAVVKYAENDDADLGTVLKNLK